MKSNAHIYSFAGGELLAKMGAWWFVSYAYYLYVDHSHMNWNDVKTAGTRRSVFKRSTRFHDLWLHEILSMKQLDVHGNSGHLNSYEIKRMAVKVLAVLPKISELRKELESLEADLIALQGKKSM